MSATLVSLLLFAAWSLVLVLLVGLYRFIASQTQHRQANTFSASGTDLPGLGLRITRAHANTYEFLPVAGVVMLAAVSLNLTALTDGLAYVFLTARILQSVVHIISTSVIAVYVRFGFFAVQVGVVFYWIYLLLNSGTV